MKLTPGKQTRFAIRAASSRDFNCFASGNKEPWKEEDRWTPEGLKRLLISSTGQLPVTRVTECWAGRCLRYTRVHGLVSVGALAEAVQLLTP